MPYILHKIIEKKLNKLLFDYSTTLLTGHIENWEAFKLYRGKRDALIEAMNLVKKAVQERLGDNAEQVEIIELKNE